MILDKVRIKDFEVDTSYWESLNGQLTDLKKAVHTLDTGPRDWDLVDRITDLTDAKGNATGVPPRVMKDYIAQKYIDKVRKNSGLKIDALELDPEERVDTERFIFQFESNRSSVRIADHKGILTKWVQKIVHVNDGVTNNYLILDVLPKRTRNPQIMEDTRLAVSKLLENQERPFDSIDYLLFVSLNSFQNRSPLVERYVERGTSGRGILVLSEDVAELTEFRKEIGDRVLGRGITYSRSIVDEARNHKNLFKNIRPAEEILTAGYERIQFSLDSLGSSIPYFIEGLKVTVPRAYGEYEFEFNFLSNHREAYEKKIKKELVQIYNMLKPLSSEEQIACLGAVLDSYPGFSGLKPTLYGSYIFPSKFFTSMGEMLRLRLQGSDWKVSDFVRTVGDYVSQITSHSSGGRSDIYLNARRLPGSFETSRRK